MTVLINDLLEEAVRTSTELASEAERATDEAAEILQWATRLGQLAEEELPALHESMQDAVKAIRQAAGQVDEESGEATGALQALYSKPAIDSPEPAARKVESAVRELAADVARDATRLAELRYRVLTGMHDTVQDIDARFIALEERVRVFQATLEARLEQAGAPVDALRQTVAEARAALPAEARQVREAIREVGALGLDVTDGFLKSRRALMVIIGRNVVAFCNAAVEAHNAGVRALRVNFTADAAPGAPDDLPTWIRAALQAPRDALAGFGLLAPPAAEALDATATALVQKAQKALVRLDAMARSLQRAIAAVSP